MASLRAAELKLQLQQAAAVLVLVVIVVVVAEAGAGAGAAIWSGNCRVWGFAISKMYVGAEYGICLSICHDICPP